VFTSKFAILISKSEILVKLITDENVDIIALQETHTVNVMIYTEEAQQLGMSYLAPYTTNNMVLQLYIYCIAS